MPPISPPRHYRGIPCSVVLPADTRLYRVHLSQWGATLFSPVVADAHFGGGRFDPTAEDQYPYVYAALTPRTALAEVLLRGFPFDEHGSRLLPRAAVRNRLLSTIELANEVNLLSLTTHTELAAVGQDEWLIHAEPGDYGKTRRWAQWLRKQAPRADGLIWSSKRDMGQQAVILFGDRCGQALKPSAEPPVELDDEGPGEQWLNTVLAPFHTKIRRPRR